MRKESRHLFMIVLGALIVIGFFVLLYALVFHPVPEENENALNLAIGALIASFSMVVSYYFGSSSGSHDKDEIAKLKERPDQGAIK